jgi:ketosteroid isomerase-like protein
MMTPTGQTLPPSGKAVKIRAAQCVIVEDGRITETRHYFDLMTLLSQIGALPAPASA